MSRTHKKSKPYRRQKHRLERHYGSNSIFDVSTHCQIWHERCPWCDSMTLGFEGKLECSECGPISEDEFPLGFSEVA